MKFIALMLLINSPVKTKLGEHFRNDIDKQSRLEAVQYAKKFCSCYGGMQSISYAQNYFVFYCTKSPYYAYEIAYNEEYNGGICL